MRLRLPRDVLPKRPKARIAHPVIPSRPRGGVSQKAQDMPALWTMVRALLDTLQAPF